MPVFPEYDEVGWLSALVPDIDPDDDVMLYRLHYPPEPTCGHPARIPGTDQCEDCGAHLDGEVDG